MMPIRFSLFYFFLIVMVKVAYSQPLTLQWEVSHSRNRDQISLIFKPDHAELVVNTSLWQEKGLSPRFGRFRSPVTSTLKRLQRDIRLTYIQLRQTVPMASLIKDPRFKPEVDPHAPVLRVNEEELRNGDPYFKPLEEMIHGVWQQANWTCIECASYKRKKDLIERTVKKITPDFSGKGANPSQLKKSRYQTDTKNFSRQALNCISKGTRNKIECVDPRFGIFEIW